MLFTLSLVCLFTGLFMLSTVFKRVIVNMLVRKKENKRAIVILPNGKKLKTHYKHVNPI